MSLEVASSSRSNIEIGDKESEEDDITAKEKGMMLLAELAEEEEDDADEEICPLSTRSAPPLLQGSSAFRTSSLSSSSMQIASLSDAENGSFCSSDEESGGSGSGSSKQRKSSALRRKKKKKRSFIPKRLSTVSQIRFLYRLLRRKKKKRLVVQSERNLRSKPSSLYAAKNKKLRIEEEEEEEEGSAQERAPHKVRSVRVLAPNEEEEENSSVRKDSSAEKDILTVEGPQAPSPPKFNSSRKLFAFDNPASNVQPPIPTQKEKEGPDFDDDIASLDLENQTNDAQTDIHYSPVVPRVVLTTPSPPPSPYPPPPPPPPTITPVDQTPKTTNFKSAISRLSSRVQPSVQGIRRQKREKKKMTFRGMLLSTFRALLGIKPPGQMAKKVVMRGKDSDQAVNSVGTTIVDSIALTAVGTGLYSIFFTTGKLIDFSSMMNTLFGPITSYQKRRLSNLGTMRGETNRLRGMVNDLNDENNKLTSSVDRLEASVSSVEKVEKKLSEVAKTNNIDRLVRVVKEYKKVTKKIKKNLEARVIQDIMTCVVRSDRDGDFMIGPKEMKLLLYRLRGIDGVSFNEEKFSELLGIHDGEETHFKLGRIMNVMRNLLNEDVPDDESVFTIDTKDEQ